LEIGGINKMTKKSPKIKLNKYVRREELQDIKSFIVIAVEGDRAEPSYFGMIKEKFKDSIRLEIIPSNKNSSPKYLLENLRRIKRECSDYNFQEKPESLWMVCDVDLHKNFQSTIKEAKNEGFKIAISNPCFEVWLFLHLAEIKIVKGLAKFCKLSGEVLLEVDNSRKPERTLSQKVKKVLDKVRPKKGAQKYEDIYFERVDDATKKAQKNLKNIQSKDFLLESKHIGQTRVSELISEIKDKSKLKPFVT
jgi:hypothetical protein